MAKPMKISVRMKKQKGRYIYYPACELSMLICSILEREQLSEYFIGWLDKAGCSIERIG